MIVIGGYNSSNTCNLARICADDGRRFTSPIRTAWSRASEIRHRPVGTKPEATATGWLPAAGPVSIGLTSGASTPDNLVGAAVAKLRASATPESQTVEKLALVG